MSRFFILTFICFILPITAHAKILDIQVIRDVPGMRIWLVEDHSAPIISMQFAFLGQGSRNDGQDKQGLARMVSNTMDEGAGNLDSKAFQKELNDRSIQLSFGITRDDFTGSVYTLSREKNRAFELLGLALSKPRFDKDAIERMRAGNISRLRSSMTDPEWMVARLQNSELFINHPYALNSGGTLSSLNSITRDDLIKTHQSIIIAPIVIAIAGDITKDDALNLVDQSFSAPKASGTPHKLSPIIFPSPKTVLFSQNMPQTLVEMALPAPSPHDADYISAEIMNFIFGAGGFGSRLTEIIREKNGLTYGIYSNFQHMDGANILSISSSTKNETAEKLLSLTRAEIDRMREQSISKQEMSSAVSYLRGSTILSLTSTQKISSFMLGLMQQNLPVDYLDQRDSALANATLQDVNQSAAKWLDSKKLVTILLGKPENVTPDKNVTILPNVE